MKFHLLTLLIPTFFSNNLVQGDQQVSLDFENYQLYSNRTTPIQKNLQTQQLRVGNFPIIQSGGKQVLVTPKAFIKHQLKGLTSKYALIPVPDG